MRSTLILGVLTFLLFSCTGSNKSNQGEEQITKSVDDPLNPLGIDSALLIEGEYLFYLNEEIYPPIISEGDSSSFTKAIDEKELLNRKNTITSDMKSEFNLTLNEDDIFITTFSGFFVSDISEDVALQILSNTGKVSRGQQNFTIQNIRARMQGDGPVLQNIRARMQEWQYDEDLHTSMGVLFVNPNSNTTSSQRKVWIVDSGVDINHQDLNVLADPLFSKSFVQSEPDPLYDLVGHGTHLAGIIGGRAHNNSNPDLLGMNGVSPGAPIVSLKVINWNGEGTWTNVKKALSRIRDRGASGDVVTLSLGDLLPGQGQNPNCNFHGDLLDQIKALANLGIYVVMAAGNTGISSTRFYPACFEYPSNVYTVASLNVTYDFTGNQFYAPVFSTYSNFGRPTIDYVAPGDVIFSTFPGNRYAVLSGTSMATAMVAGIIHLKGGPPSANETLTGPPGNTLYPIAKY